jgi:hypothetical protein
MNRIRYILRILFFLFAIVLLVQLNRKTDDRVESVAEFKYKMFQKLKPDSLDSKHKLDLLVNETTKFVDDSSQVKDGIHYLMVLLGLLVVTEFVFLLLVNRNSRG